MDDQYLGAVGGVFDASIERIDGIVGYAVDTIYGFDVDGVTVDTIFFADQLMEVILLCQELFH